MSRDTADETKHNCKLDFAVTRKLKRLNSRQPYDEEFKIIRSTLASTAERVTAESFARSAFDHQEIAGESKRWDRILRDRAVEDLKQLIKRESWVGFTIETDGQGTAPTEFDDLSNPAGNHLPTSSSLPSPPPVLRRSSIGLPGKSNHLQLLALGKANMPPK
jgi:hypothetical protein